LAAVTATGGHARVFPVGDEHRSLDLHLSFVEAGGVVFAIIVDADHPAMFKALGI
jgi:hypothetical protein